MSLGRLIPVVSAVVLAGGVAVAQPKAPAPAPAPVPAPADGAGSGSGSAVAPIEDAPPSDMEGTSEDPDAPRGDEPQPGNAPVAAPAKKSGYPVEEAQRPITLPQNMSEVSIAPHFVVSPFSGGDALHARYGITRQVQLGLTYVFGAVFDDKIGTPMSKKYEFHVGKTAGLDVTVLVKNWLGVRVGLPVYFDPFAMSFTAGAPMKFVFDKFAIGALDDVLNIRITKFAPRFDFEEYNFESAKLTETNSETSRGFIRIAGYGVYQHKPTLAFIGRIGVENDLGSGGDSGLGTGGSSGATTFVRAGVQVTPKRFLDLGLNAGFEDLARSGSFGLAGFLAVRI